MTDHLKPGERALEAIKKMDNAVVEFKMPKLPRTKKGHMKILTEEQYVEVEYYHFSKSFHFVSFCIFIVCLFAFFQQELGKIIQKDFFPDLEKLKAQNEYLDAMERNDMIKLREIYAKYSGNRPTDQLGCKLSPNELIYVPFALSMNCC